MAYDAEDPKALGLITFGPVPGVYMNLFEAKAVVVNGKPSGEPKYSSNFVFETEVTGDLAEVRKTAIAVAKANWPGRDLKELAWPWSSGDKLADKAERKGKKRDFYRGKTVLVARSKFEPKLGVLEANPKKLVEYLDDKRPLCKKFFNGGTLVLGRVNMVPYNGVGNNQDGVTAYLDSVISTGKKSELNIPTSQGESLQDTFKGYIGLVKDEDPTAGMDDDEIPF